MLKNNTSSPPTTRHDRLLVAVADEVGAVKTGEGPVVVAWGAVQTTMLVTAVGMGLVLSLSCVRHTGMGFRCGRCRLDGHGGGTIIDGDAGVVRQGWTL